MSEKSNKEAWLSGEPLYVAWFIFGPARMKEQYQNATSEHRRLGLRSTLEGDVAAQLHYGDLEALGIKSDRIGSICIDTVPNFLFLSEGCHILWDKSQILWNEVQYNDVRIIRAANPNPATNHFGNDNAEIAEPKRNKLGRADTYPLAKQILIQLYRQPANRLLTAGRLHPAFSEEFRAKFPNVPPPVARTLQEQLKRFRKELEENGNNDVSH